jgi:glucose-fructose oxidoreductase
MSKPDETMAYTVAGINFAHFHMGDHLRAVESNPDTELVGICDEDQETATLGLDDTAAEFSLNDDQVFTDHEQCLEATDPDIVITCPTPVGHADWVEKLMAHDVDVILEKPFADSVADADRIIDAVESSGNRLLVNWPLAWYPTHRTAKRLIDEGTIGELAEVHYYDGNRGSHRFTQVEYTDSGEMHFAGEETEGAPDAEIWFHDAEVGGGSLMDYLGYGVTLGTWFRDGEVPTEVTTETHDPDWSEVDEQSVTVARYDTGLSTFQTSWNTFTDPWATQPQPKCGFVLKGTEGTIASYDYQDAVRVQTADDPEGHEVPVDELEPPLQDSLQYMVHCIAEEQPVEFGPVSILINRKGQRIVDAARESAARGETVPLPE